MSKIKMNAILLLCGWSLMSFQVQRNALIIQNLEKEYSGQDSICFNMTQQSGTDSVFVTIGVQRRYNNIWKLYIRDINDERDTMMSVFGYKVKAGTITNISWLPCNSGFDKLYPEYFYGYYRFIIKVVYPEHKKEDVYSTPFMIKRNRK